MTPATLARLHAAAMTTTRPWSAAEFAALMASQGVFVTGDSRGFAMGRAVADQAELLTLVTHPDHRRRGLARACLNDFHRHAARLGARESFLEVAADNDPALRLYERAGYAQNGMRKGYYAAPDNTPVDALLMARPLRGI